MGMQQISVQKAQQAQQLAQLKSRIQVEQTAPAPPTCSSSRRPTNLPLSPPPSVPEHGTSFPPPSGTALYPPGFHPGNYSAVLPPRTERAPSTAAPSVAGDLSSRAGSPPHSDTPRHFPNASVQKNLKVPKYTGTEDVNGFFRKFEALTRQMGASEEEKKALLIGKLEGAADQWLMG